MRPGHCPVCKRNTLFISRDDWLRESYKCIFCHSRPRQRALVKVLNETVPDWQHKIIHESSPGGGATYKMFQKACSNYTYSYFYEEKALGVVLDEQCSNQNLENMTFKDESFDIIITQDVFEHINYPFKAFQEIERVLKPGGYHIFTVPIDNPFVRTIPRVKMENGIRIPILPEVYHGNPIDKEKGSLVTYDWGNDICGLIESCSGMRASMIAFDKYQNCHENARLGLEAYSLYVFIAAK